MKKRQIVGHTAILMLSIFAFHKFACAADGDWQIWSTAGVQGKVYLGWTVKLEEQFRFGNQAADIYYHHVQTDLVYQIRSWMALGLTYRHIYMKVAGIWQQEKRPTLGVALSTSRSIYRLEMSQKLERHIRDWSDNGWSYRNKLSVTLEKSWTQFDVKPYLADEIFVNLKGGGVYRNRLFAGVKSRLFDKIYPDLFFLWQSTESPVSWTDFYVLGGNLNFRF
ncbi:MAG: DUF2490 domain-containing protein [candidate division Zixibacteria bacterium]|nr:DUF2490 domain-containing protein [candidate division Zixibacteria bacterium]